MKAKWTKSKIEMRIGRVTCLLCEIQLRWSIVVKIDHLTFGKTTTITDGRTSNDKILSGTSTDKGVITLMLEYIEKINNNEYENVKGRIRSLIYKNEYMFVSAENFLKCQ